ncbi:hypothetical protein SVAN01_10295 [Stagonosporopsis vannaccii]|nr:hypothetical protein SVAN01_10295 [Stagonosporopsis vannaccii]
MSEPVGVTSELQRLVEFSLKSSTSLYETTKGFNSPQRSVREFRKEVGALVMVLSTLKDALPAHHSDFAALRLLLLRCGNACEDLEASILKSVEGEGETRATFKNWASVKYMGDDITTFKSMVAAYKSTIIIALFGANLHTSNVTANVLDDYQETIDETISDLEDNLEKTDEKLQGLLVQGFDNEMDAVKHGLQDEKECILKCLDICTEVASHIDSVRRSQVPQSDSAVHGDSTASVPANTAGTRNIEQVLGRYQDDFSGVLLQLTRSLEEVRYRQQTLHGHSASPNQDTQQQKLQEKIGSIKQSLTMCTKASKHAFSDRTNVFEDITMADDGHQVIVSTFGDLVCAKKVSAGARSSQWLGQMSDESLQRLSQARYQDD